MRILYPEIEPYAVHRFKRNKHRVYVEECGNSSGVPVLFLHGGPGSGCKAYHRSFFNPETYRIILVDQRGAGRSVPHGEIVGNTTADLIRDLDYIRRELRIDRWLLFGGSWGATLALLYAQRHPTKVAGLVLRAAFLARQRDLDWFVGSGVDRIYPEQWEQFMDNIPEPDRDHPLPYLYSCLTGDDEVAQRRAARTWALWSGQVILGSEFAPSELNGHVSSEALNKARIELHYAVNRYFIPENAVLDQCERIRHLPAILIHGRRDLVCPVESSFSLRKRLPKSELRVLPNAGHIAAGEDMIDALVGAADEMAEWFDS
ncbi:prolyl aminopeptidase [Methylocaldum szegediense]|uniref:Proline iminopeptidase n=1 Tax=Methylocaldum szegediense TaxID=73780 RepID=A0ABN8XCM1_9GAMM|nr:prolyl aminopeptidase [Methylocaldum szegediense]CAI8973764.1 Proline iminopeptidase [Methylocaldum szegediense]